MQTRMPLKTTALPSTLVERVVRLETQENDDCHELDSCPGGPADRRRGQRRIESKFLTPYEYRRDRSNSASNRKQCRNYAMSLTGCSGYSSMTRQPIQSRFRHGIGTAETRAKRQQEFWMRRLFSEFLDDESGATAIEYCLIAVGISIVILTAVNGLGSTLNGTFASVNTSLK